MSGHGTVGHSVRDEGSWMATLEPSRAWIVGLTVGPDGRIESPADRTGERAPVAPSAPDCECPDDCPRDHPNE